MKLKIFLFGVAVAISLSLNAQFVINGSVYNSETKKPLEGANVVIEKTNNAVSTNKDGKYSIANLKSQIYQLKVSFVGYENYFTEIQLNNDKTLDIYLKPKVFFNEEIIINGIRANENTPTAFINLSKENIQHSHDARNITSVIDMTPSMVTTSDAGTGIGNVGYRIRGTDETRINVTINGVPLNDAESQGAWFVNLPDFASSVDNLQIQRGVGTSTNGAAAFGGSLNFQTLKIETVPYAKINEVYGSFNTFKHNLNFGTGLIGEKFTIDGRISKVTSDGYIDRAFADLNSYYLSAGYYGKKTIIKAMILSGKQRSYQAWDGIPSNILDTNRTYNGIGEYYDANGVKKNYDNETDNYNQTHYHLMFSHDFNYKFNFTANVHYTRGFGYYEQYKDDDKFSKYNVQNQIIGTDTIEKTDVIRRKYLDNHFYGTTMALNYEANKNLSLTVGGAINQFSSKHYGKVIWMQYSASLPNEFEYYRGFGEKTDANIFFKGNYKFFSNFNYWFDLQYRLINYDITGIDDKFRDIKQSHIWDFFNPKTGISYKLNEFNNIYTSFAVAHREPTRSNLVDANIDERPTTETLYDFEIGHNFKIKKFAFTTNLYYMDYKDQLVLTGNINDVGDAVMKNVKSSYRAGIELSAFWQITKMFKWQINTTFSQNKIKNFTEFVDDWDTWGQQSTYLGETNLSFSPEIIAANNFTIEPIKDFSISILSKYVGSQFIDNTSSNERKLDAYIVNNLTFRYSLKTKFIKKIDIFLNINNILDEEYETNAWIYSYYSGGVRSVLDGYFPQAGRNFMTGISVKF